VQYRRQAKDGGDRQPESNRNASHPTPVSCPGPAHSPAEKLADVKELAAMRRGAC
jgi:hypothetical protein